MAVAAISDYAIIGDCRSAALISSQGSIDWLCWPRFDSPSIFAAILDDRAGHWTIAPAWPFRSQRRYIEGTNVLQTRFDIEGGSLLVTDLMPVASEREKRRILVPDHEIVRLVECTSGEVDLKMLFHPRPNYARTRIRASNAGKLGIRIQTDNGLLILRTDADLNSITDGGIEGLIPMRAGDARFFSLTFTDEWNAVLPPLGDWTRDAIARSVAWWRRWSSQLKYTGPDRDAVMRSALALKLMVYAPSGAVVAAPTTSLPERIGGDLNWDYRYCWLRDASLTMRALFGLGCQEEAEAFVSWLLHSTRLTRPELRVLYDVYGRVPNVEEVLGHFDGYRGSRPVRIGNAAADQLQLDVYGEVIDAVSYFVKQGGRLDRETQKMLLSFGRYVCRNWQRPDEGIWEPRSGRRHNTHSRVLCWTAVDRLLELAAKGHLSDRASRRLMSELQDTRSRIRRDIEQRAWNPKLSSYVATLDGQELDASLLLIPWYGFEDASSERMRKTYARIVEQLGADEALLYRYRVGESAAEGTFGICSFWGAEYLALGGGSPEHAREVFESLLTYANDVGLFAEEIDPYGRAALGNFPQAFTHVGLINAAVSLAQRLEGEKPHERTLPLREKTGNPELRS